VAVTNRILKKETGSSEASDLFEAGLVYAEECEWDEAVATFRECLRLNPHHAQAHCQLGNILSDRGSLIEAETEYREALGLKVNFLEAFKGMADCLYRQDREEEAKICWRRALGLEKSPSERERIAFLLSEDG
jgi:tetratricopeptide (TPR) repeat protein